MYKLNNLNAHANFSTSIFSCPNISPDSSSQSRMVRCDSSSRCKRECWCRCQPGVPYTSPRGSNITELTEVHLYIPCRHWCNRKAHCPKGDDETSCVFLGPILKWMIWIMIALVGCGYCCCLLKRSGLDVHLRHHIERTLCCHEATAAAQGLEQLPQEEAEVDVPPAAAATDNAPPSYSEATSYRDQHHNNCPLPRYEDIFPNQ